jgi:hypothetical protein
MANGIMNMPFSPVMDEEERRRMQMQHLQSQQEPMPERVDVGAYLDDMAAIQQNRNKWASRARMFGGNVQFPSVGGDVKERAGIRDEMIQAEILKRQRDAVLRGDISNIDEQMGWYQSSGFDPHFAKTAREAAQSIFAQRRAQTGEERAVAGEERAVLGEARAVTAAEQAAERFKFAQAEADRKQKEFNASQTTEARNELIALRENELLAWAADKWWALQPEERTEAKREEIAREMAVHARDEDFKGFSIVAGKTVPDVGRGITTTPPVPVDLNEKSLIDTFRNEAKVVLKDEEKEDEDFVSAPARTYSDQYEEDWRTAADDFETASDLAGTINAAIRADESIAPENKQAVLEQVLKNLESVEKGVGRPTEPAERAYLKKERSHEERLHGATDDLSGDIANKTRVYIEIMDEYLGGNIFLEGMSKGLREAMVFDRMMKIMSYGPNPILRPVVELLQENVAASTDEEAQQEHIMQFAMAYRIPPDMALYLSNPEAFKKRKF